MKTTHSYVFWGGIWGLIGAGLLFLEIPLWIIPGSPPQMHEAAAHAAYLSDIRVIALSRIVIDMLMYMSLMLFFAGFSQMMKRAHPELDWIARLNFNAGVVWWAVSLVADGLEGAAVLNTLNGNTDPSAVRALVDGTILIYNGAIAFAVTALYLGSSGYLIYASKTIPKWIGALGWLGFALCMLSIPAIYTPEVNTNGFYNAAGWGPTIVANTPPLIWFIAAGISMIQYAKKQNQLPL